MPIHKPQACKGEFCPLHNPSNHHMKDWPVVIRSSALVERTCPHGVGHPDPDSLAYFDRTWAMMHKSQFPIEIEGETESEHCLGIHGCDGCCNEREFLAKQNK